MNAIIIFIKNPIAGQAKTRLAAEVGGEKAMAIYKSLLAYTRTVSLMVNAERYLYYSGEILDDEWDVSSFNKKLQSGKDLGARMSNAFKEVLSTNDKVLIIGSDCPQLNLMTISKAFSELDSHDHVIGPSKDGGYYLLGMKSYNPEVFTGIDWSTDAVCNQTIQKINLSDRTYGLIEELSDVDYKEDWEKYGWEL